MIHRLKRDLRSASPILAILFRRDDSEVSCESDCQIADLIRAKLAVYHDFLSAEAVFFYSTFHWLQRFFNERGELLANAFLKTGAFALRLF